MSPVTLLRLSVPEPRRAALGALYFAVFIALVYAANWALITIGVIPVGFGLVAPAGVLFAGASFLVRDPLEDTLGRWAVLLAIGAGAVVSYQLSETFAIASAAAFLTSEIADFLVYQPLKRRTWIGAVALSNTVGLLCDSVLFLSLAALPMAYLPGQIVGKLEITVAFIVAYLAWRATRSGRR